MRTVRDCCRSAATYVLLCAIYLALWCGVAWRAGQLGPAGLDVDRRGPQVLAAVSLLDVSAVLVLVPVLVVGRAPRPAWIGVAVVFAIATVGLFVVERGSARIDLSTVAATRVLLLATAGLAAAAARLAAAVCRDEYDATGAVFLAVALAVGAVVFTAPLLARLTDAGPVIAGLLLANPVVAMAGATSFDLLRTDVLYRITPVGQRLFDYPSWHAAALTYAAGALLCFAATTLIRIREA